MKKFFTLIAAVAMAASMNAQTTYSMVGLTGDDFTYDDWFSYNDTKKQFDYLTGSKTDLGTIELKDTPVSFMYKNASSKSKIFTISDTYFCAQGKNVQVSVSGLAAGQEVSFSVGSKGSTASDFALVSGGELVEEMPTFAAKKDDNITFLTIKVKATDNTVVIKENAGGFGIESVIVGEAPTTGITNVNAISANSGKIYNIAGQEVSESYKGLVIKNGKKYVK